MQVSQTTFRVLSQKLAEVDEKYANRNKRQATADRVLPTNTALGWLADVGGGNVWGDERAGRAVTLASRAGMDSKNLLVSSPKLHRLVAMLAGTGVGAGVGAGAGAALGYGPAGDVDGNMVAGGAIGAGVGAIGGWLVEAALRRREMRDIKSQYASKRKDLKAPVESYADAGTILGGSHYKGRVDANRYLDGMQANVRSPGSGYHDAASIIGPAVFGMIPGGSIGFQVGHDILKGNLADDRNGTAKYSWFLNPPSV